MKTIIEVNCVDQDLEFVTQPLVASGGFHEDFVKFTFCSLWDGFEKTAVFYRDIRKPYYMMVDEMGMCEIPYEVLSSAGTLYMGVFGVLRDVTRTSKILRYQIKNGAVTTGLVPTEPTPDIWQQLLQAYDTILDKVEESNEDQRAFIAEANKAVVDCNLMTEECRVAIANLNYTASDLDGGDPSTEEVVEDQNDVNGGSPY